MDAGEYADRGAVDQLALSIEADAEAIEGGIEPAAVPPASLLTDEERQERILNLLATEGFDRWSTKLGDLTSIHWERMRTGRPHQDSDEGLRSYAAYLAQDWRWRTEADLTHLWHVENRKRCFCDRTLADEKRRTMYELFAWLDANAGTSYYHEAGESFAAGAKYLAAVDATEAGRFGDPRWIEKQLRLLASASSYAELRFMDADDGEREEATLANEPARFASREEPAEIEHPPTIEITRDVWTVSGRRHIVEAASPDAPRAPGRIEPVIKQGIDYTRDDRPRTIRNRDWEDI